MAVLLLMLIELGLQVRSQIRTGQSAFSLLSGKTIYRHDAETGLRLLRPSAEIRGSRSTMRTNRYGLRGPDFPPAPEPGEMRIAVLGSSAVMGTYASDDQHTSSAGLERILRGEGRDVRVINAGVAGLTIDDQRTLLERRLLSLGLDALVWIPGANDITCRSVESDSADVGARLAVPSLPRWLLLPDLLIKNTAWLRPRNVSGHTSLRPHADYDALAASLRDGVMVAGRAGLPVMLVISPRAFDAGMSDGELERRAAGALGFRPCYTARQFAEAIARFDKEVLGVTASESGAALLDARSAVGMDPRFFGDSTHLSDEGEERMARVLASGLERYLWSAEQSQR